MTRDEVILYYKSEMESAKNMMTVAENTGDATESKRYRGIAERAEWAYRALSVDYESMLGEIEDFQHTDGTTMDQAVGAEKALEIVQRYARKYVTIE